MCPFMCAFAAIFIKLRRQNANAVDPGCPRWAALLVLVGVRCFAELVSGKELGNALRQWEVFSKAVCVKVCVCVLEQRRSREAVRGMSG